MSKGFKGLQNASKQGLKRDRQESDSQDDGLDDSGIAANEEDDTVLEDSSIGPVAAHPSAPHYHLTKRPRYSDYNNGPQYH
jgi:hypothetical protein